PGPRRPRRAGGAPRRLPRRVRAAGAARVRGRYGREPPRLRPVVAALAGSRGGRAPPAHAGARSVAPRRGGGAPGGRARRRAGPRAPGAARSGRGGAEPARAPRHGAAPSVSLRRARHARRLPAGGDAPLDAGGGSGRGGGRDRLVQIEAHAAEAAREARFHPPPEGLYLPAAAWRAALADRPRVEVEALEVLDGAALQAT